MIRRFKVLLQLTPNKAIGSRLWNTNHSFEKGIYADISVEEGNAQVL